MGEDISHVAPSLIGRIGKKARERVQKRFVREGSLEGIGSVRRRDPLLLHRRGQWERKRIDEMAHCKQGVKHRLKCSEAVAEKIKERFLLMELLVRGRMRPKVTQRLLEFRSGVDCSMKSIGERVPCARIMKVRGFR